jgi:hypothetical protein
MQITLPCARNLCAVEFKTVAANVPDDLLGLPARRNDKRKSAVRCDAVELVDRVNEKNRSALLPHARLRRRANAPSASSAAPNSGNAGGSGVAVTDASLSMPSLNSREKLLASAKVGSI